MATTAAAPLARQRTLILTLLLVLAVAAWALLLWQARTTDAAMAMTPTMGMGAPLFLAIWVVMMVAIMFPTAAPMILTFARVQAGRRQKEQPFVPTWVFVGAYLLVWSALGILAYLGAVLAERLAGRSMWFMDNAGRIGGVVLIAAGLYQLTPLKQLCLAKCRSPMAFIMTSWRSGYGGAFRMGIEHGLYCAGCCWLLFVILFPLGMLNIAALALITALIFAEKSLPFGLRLSWVAGAALVAYGLLVLFMPDALPTMM
jgi:predicted metal-binding membrane protein